MNRKIEIFLEGKYLCYTKACKTLKEAIANIKKPVFIRGKYWVLRKGKITAHFAKE